MPLWHTYFFMNIKYTCKNCNYTDTLLVHSTDTVQFVVCPNCDSTIIID